MAFTNPCDRCEYKGRKMCRNRFKSCGDYRYWLNYNFKMARIKLRKLVETEEPRNSWVYHHPDDVRRFLKDGVCGKCPLNGNCNEPCSAYLAWWDARMEYFRKVAGI